MIKGKGISGLGKHPGSNLRGLGAHPSKKSAVKNPPPQVGQFGRDSFHERNQRSGAPVVKGQK